MIVLVGLLGGCKGFEAAFDRAAATEFAGRDVSQHETVDRGHGRVEDRSVTVIRNPTGLP